MESKFVVAIFVIMCGLSHAIAEMCVGCPLEHDVNDGHIKTVLSDSLSKLQSAPAGTTEQVKVLRLTKATTQVVSGIKYSYEFEGEGLSSGKPYVCRMSVWDRPWLKATKVLEYTCTEQAEGRSKRSVAANVGDLDVTDLKPLINEELNKEGGYPNLRAVMSIERISIKESPETVVRAVVTVAQTSCGVGSGKSLDECTFRPQIGVEKCNVELRMTPFLSTNGNTKVNIVGCHKKPVYLGFCAGCPFEGRADDVDVNQVLRRTIYNLNAKSENKLWELHNITKVQKQVVSGLRYMIEFEATDEEGEKYLCQSVILSQPWVNPEPAVEQFTCQPLQE